MKVAIDTNSLLSLVRYYLPFDENDILLRYFNNKIAIGEILIIDQILEECKYVSQGVIVETLKYLTDKDFLKKHKIPVNTEFLLAPSPAKFMRQLDNQFVNRVMKNRLNDTEYEVRKTGYIKSADMKLIIYCLNLIQQYPNEEVILVSEETATNNDNKLFKKIPSICRELNIITLTLPQMLRRNSGIEIEIK